MKPRSELLRKPLLATVVLLLALLLGGGTAYAEPTDDQKAEARAAADAAAAEFVCDLLPVPNGDPMSTCLDLGKTAAAKAPSIEEMQPEAMCLALLPLGLFATGGCVGLVALNVGGLREKAQKAYDDTIGKAIDAVDDVTDVVDFVKDPQGGLEDLANKLKEGATDLLNRVLTDILNMGSADFSAEWWRESYAAAGAIGLFVSAIMIILVLKDAAADRISAHQFTESFQYLFTGIVSMVWAPVFAYVAQNVVNGLSVGIVQWGGKDLLLTVLEGAIFSVTARAMPGGIVMGLFFWLMLLIGAVLVFVMFIAQGLAVYLTALAMAIAFGMLAHPRWRSKALRVPMLVLGIMLSKPLLLFVLMALFKMIQSFNPMSAFGQDGLKTLGEGFMIILSLILVGLAPWAVFRFIPLLPDGSEISGGSLDPAGAGAGAAGGAMQTMGMRRMQQGSVGGRSGGGGGGGGGSNTGSSSSTTRSAPDSPASSSGGGATGGGGQSGSGGGGSGLFGKSGKAGAASGGGGGGAVAGGAGAAGSSAGGGAAMAGGTAVSGGALLVAAAAAKSGQHMASSARTAAEGAAPQMQGSTSEELQSSLHDRRKWDE